MILTETKDEIMNIENNNGRTEYSNNNNSRGAVATRDGYTMFGFWEANQYNANAERVFRCAYGKAAKTYKNPARAAAKWLND
jgi:hypothetical protein